jgi:AcrR family transcriptional regulator
MAKKSPKERIFGAARMLFDREGAAGLSMRRIADAVGVTPMALYKHYADKDAILNALMLDGFAAWEARASKIEERNPVIWLERMGGAFLDFALKEPRRYEAAFLLRASQARQYPRDFEERRSPVMSRVHDRIEEAKSCGKLGGATAIEIGLAFSALSQGLVSMYLAGRFASEKEFRTAYHGAIGHCISSYKTGQKA